MTVTKFEVPAFPHVQQELPDTIYHSLPLMSASRLRILERSTSLHLAHSMANPSDSPALAVGRALHCKVLTPSLYLRDFVVAPQVDRRTKEGKATWESFIATAGNRTVLTTEQAEEVSAMAASIEQHPDAKMIVSGLAGTPEVSLFAEIAGVKAKSRFDRLVEVGDERIIVDVKTTSGSASQSEFEKTIWNFGYGIQSAFYLEMARACGVPAQHFVFVVVEKTAPYAVAVYRFNDAIASAFRPRMLELVSQYKTFVEEGPKGYEGVTEIGIPAWAVARIAPNLGEFNEV
jgi:exodeoxyribonuclease VIII